MAVTPFDLPDGCLGSYHPEMNPLMPLSHHDDPSKTPAAKSVAVRIDATDRSGLFSAQGEASGEARRSRPADANPHPVPS